MTNTNQTARQFDTKWRAFIRQGVVSHEVGSGFYRFVVDRWVAAGSPRGVGTFIRATAEAHARDWRPIGRPSLSGRGPAARVEIKLSPKDRAAWTAAAEREGLTLSEWLRAAAELAIARGATR